MEVVNYTEFRKNLKANLDLVSDDFETVIIARPDKKNVVLISLDEYNSINATMHELSSENNRKRLEESIAEFKKGNFLKKKLIEVI
jgi:antitoxin YefM